MSKWDEYQDFSTTAKLHGGANAYLDFLINNAKEEGILEGRTEGIIFGITVTVISGVVVFTGFYAYNKTSEYLKKRKFKKQLTSNIREDFLENVEQYERDITADPSNR